MRQTQKKRRKNRDEKRKKVENNAKEWKRIKIFIIVRMIRHREIRGNEDDDAERLYEIIRLAITIINHSESYR